MSLSPPPPAALPVTSGSPLYTKHEELYFLIFLAVIPILILLCLCISWFSWTSGYVNHMRFRKRLDRAKPWIHDKRRTLTAYESRLWDGSPFPAYDEGHELLHALPRHDEAVYWVPLEPQTIWKLEIEAGPPDIAQRVSPKSQPYPDLKFWMKLECTSPPGATLQTFTGSGQIHTYAYAQSTSRLKTPVPFAGQHVRPRAFDLRVHSAEFDTSTGKGFAKLCVERRPLEVKEGDAAADKGGDKANGAGKRGADKAKQKKEINEKDIYGDRDHAADMVLYFVRAHPNDDRALYGTLYTFVGAWDTPFSTRLHRLVRTAISHTTSATLVAQPHYGFRDAPAPRPSPISPFQEKYHPLNPVDPENPIFDPELPEEDEEAGRPRGDGKPPVGYYLLSPPAKKGPGMFAPAEGEQPPGEEGEHAPPYWEGDNVIPPPPNPDLYPGYGPDDPYEEPPPPPPPPPQPHNYMDPFYRAPAPPGPPGAQPAAAYPPQQWGGPQRPPPVAVPVSPNGGRRGPIPPFQQDNFYDSLD